MTSEPLHFPGQMRSLVVTDDAFTKPMIHRLLYDSIPSVNYILFYCDKPKAYPPQSESVFFTDNIEAFSARLFWLVPHIIQKGGTVWVIIDAHDIGSIIPKLNGTFEIMLFAEKPFMHFTVITDNPNFNNDTLFDQYILDTKINIDKISHLLPNQKLKEVYLSGDRRYLGWIKRLDNVYFLIDSSNKHVQIDNYHIDI